MIVRDGQGRKTRSSATSGQRSGEKSPSHGRYGADSIVPSSSESAPSGLAVPAPAGIDPPPFPTDQERPLNPPWRIVVAALAAGLIAGVASFLAGEAIMGAYQHDLQPRLQIHPDPEDMHRLM
jgi:hypothetical protein